MAFAAGEQGRHAALLHALCHRKKQAVGSTALLQTRVSEAALGARQQVAIAILGRRPPGFFWLLAIGELVSNKPCVILAASWWVSGEGQCRDETR